MTKPDELKSREHEGPVASQAVNALCAFVCAADPERQSLRKRDFRYAKFYAREILSLLASRGPKALDEPVRWPDELTNDVDQQPEFTSELGSADEWQYASRWLSQYYSKLVEIIGTMDKKDPLVPDLFEALGMLAYAQTRIAQVLDNAK